MNINVNKDFMKQEFFTVLKQMSLQKMYFLRSSANIQKFCASRSLIFHVGLYFLVFQGENCNLSGLYSFIPLSVATWG